MSTNATFKAFRITAQPHKVDAGFVECGLDDLDPGAVVVRVAYSDVNYKDALAATGAGKVLRRPSCIGGIDFAGTVLSSSDRRFSPGDRVLAAGHDLGVAHHGGYAEIARVPGDWLVPLPAGLSLWDAMALGTAGFTTALAVTRLEQSGLTPAEGPVLVSGATGGVGSLSVAALARLGYRVTALTRKTHERSYLERLGAAETLSPDALDLGSIRPLGKATWAGAVDNVGGDVLAWIISTMKPNGAIASIGLARSATLATTVLPFILRGVSLLGVNSSDAPSLAVRDAAWRRLAGDLHPLPLTEIARTIPFDELPVAFEEVIASRIRGRLVVRIEP